MPAWLLPAVKLILPHVTDLVAYAKPAFTRRKASEETVDPLSVIQQQIAELQTAASENVTHVKALAEQLQLTVAAIEQGAATTERRMKRVYGLAVAAVVLSMAALAASLFAVMS